MPIEGLTSRRLLPRLGKIHLGVKHPTKGYPIRTDYFVCPPEVKQVFGEKPRELSILVPVEDEEKWCSQYYRCYSKTRGLICKGDGIQADRLTDARTGALADSGSSDIVWKEAACRGRDCPDYRLRCREILNLQFLLPDVPGVGVWQIDTSSINSIVNINSAIELYRSIYKRISMLPLILSLEPREVHSPGEPGVQTIYCLNLRTRDTMADLALSARKQAEIYELPIGEDEIPECAVEHEPDPVDLPPDPRTIEQQIDELYGPEMKKEKKRVRSKNEEK
jgi:hypothetical protein